MFSNANSEYDKLRFSKENYNSIINPDVTDPLTLLKRVKPCEVSECYNTLQISKVQVTQIKRGFKEGITYEKLQNSVSKLSSKCKRLVQVKEVSDFFRRLGCKSDLKHLNFLPEAIQKNMIEYSPLSLKAYYSQYKLFEGCKEIDVLEGSDIPGAKSHSLQLRIDVEGAFPFLAWLVEDSFPVRRKTFTKFKNWQFRYKFVQPLIFLSIFDIVKKYKDRLDVRGYSKHHCENEAVPIRYYLFRAHLLVDTKTTHEIYLMLNEREHKDVLDIIYEMKRETLDLRLTSLFYEDRKELAFSYHVSDLIAFPERLSELEFKMLQPPKELMKSKEGKLTLDEQVELMKNYLQVAKKSCYADDASIAKEEMLPYLEDVRKLLALIADRVEVRNG